MVHNSISLSYARITKTIVVYTLKYHRNVLQKNVAMHTVYSFSKVFPYFAILSEVYCKGRRNKTLNLKILLFVLLLFVFVQ